MPNSLLDMFQPQDYSGKPIGFDQALRQNSGSLIGLGMGMLQPHSLAVGAPVGNSWTSGLEGYQQGATQDLRRNVAQAQLAHQKTQEARQAAMDKFHREQAGITDAQRAMRDVLGPNAAPEQKADFMKNYYASKTDPGGWILKDIIDPNDPDGERKITVQEHNRTGQIRPPQLPGQTGTAGPIGAANPFPAPGADGGGAPPVYGQGPGGFSATPQAGASAPTAAQRAITMPNGQVLTPPPGLSKDGRKAWQNHIATTAADVSSGKMTEAQGTSNLYAGKMEIANRALTPDIEKHGLDVTQNRLEKYGGWAGNVLLMSPEYQKYRDSKDAFLNSYLRRISGATVHDAEYLREEKVFFPQPGDPPEQLEYKRQLRQDAIQRMKAQVGMGYTEPPAAPTATAPSASGGGGKNPGGIPPPPAGFILRQSNR